MNYSENLGERENPIATSDNWIIRDTMHIYKELILKGNKTDFDEFKKTAASFAVGDWKFKTSNDAFNYIMRDYDNDPSSIWKSEIFGRSLDVIVKEGIQAKLSMTPENARFKLQQTLTKLVNKGSGNLFAIVI